MTLDPEVLEAIQQTIAASIKPVVDGLEKANYDNQKLSEAIAQTSTELNGKISALNPVTEYVQSLKSQEEQKKAEQPKEQTRLEKAVSEVKEQYELRFEQLRKELEARDLEAQKLRESERQIRIRTDILNQMRGLGTIRPNTEEDLLTLLEKRGLVVENGDKLFIRSQDKYGGQINAEFKDVLPKLLETDFAHFAVPRGGTGTDGQPTPKTPQTSSYGFEGMSAQQIYDLCKTDPEAMRAYDQLLEQSFGKY